MESSRSGNKVSTTLGTVRKEFTYELLSSLHRTLDVSNYEASLLDLSKHIDEALERIAQLKILDCASLSTSGAVVDVQRDWDANKARLHHMQLVADALFYLREDIKIWNVPQFEMLTSLHLLIDGNLKFLPSVMDELHAPRILPLATSANLLCAVGNKMLALIAEMSFPAGIRLQCMENGIATIVSDNEFQIKVTLIRAPPELIGNLHELEEQMQQTKNDVKTEDDPLETLEIPSFHAEIPNVDNEELEEVEGQWWWSLSELELFPCSNEGLPFLEKFQVEYLRLEFNSRMMNLATRIVAKRRIILERKLTALSDQIIDAVSSQNNQVETSQTTLESKEAEEFGIEANEDQIRPLELLLEMCRDTSTRFTLSAFRMSMKELVEQNSPFRQTCRITVSKHLTPGLRLCYWSGVPVITDKTVKGEHELTRTRSIQPFFEIGVCEEGYVGIHSFPSLPVTYEDQRSELKLDIRNPNVRELVMRSAQCLSVPIIDLLFKEIEKYLQDSHIQCENVPWQEIHYSDDSASSSACKQNNSISWSSSLIRFTTSCEVILTISICLISGKIQLESSSLVQHLASRKVPQWEEALNKAWKTTSRSPTKSGIHPHIVALSHVAETVVHMVQRLANYHQTEQTSSMTVACLQDEFGDTAFLSNLMLQQFEMTPMRELVDLSKTANFLLKTARFVINISQVKQFFSFRFLLSVNESCKNAFLVTIKCSDKNLPTEILSVIAVPCRVLNGEEYRLPTDRKRKNDENEDMIKKKRGRRNEIHEDVAFALDFAMNATTSNTALSTDLEKCESDKPLQVTNQLLDWIKSRMLFEIFANTLKALGMDFDEQYMFGSSSAVYYRIVFKNWSNALCPWSDREDKADEESFKGVRIGFLGLTRLFIDICSDSTWNLWIISRLSKENMFKPNYASCLETHSDNFSMRCPLYGNIEVIDGGVVVKYAASQSMDVMFSDLHIISTHQMFLNDLFGSGYEIGREIVKGGNSSVTIVETGLTYVILRFQRVSELNNQNWEVKYLISWAPKSSSTSGQLPPSDSDSYIAILKEIETATDKMTLESHSANRKRKFEWNISESIKRLQFPDIFNHPKRRKQSDIFKDLVAKCGVQCQVCCSLSVPDLYLQRLAELLLSGKMQDCLSSMSIVSGSLFYLQNVWTSNSDSFKWRFHMLPKSSAFGFDILCKKGLDVEYIMLLRFHEEALVFIRLFEITDLSKRSPLFQEFCQVEDLPNVVFNILSETGSKTS